MNDVGNLLSNDGVSECWVGARDLFSSDTNDGIKWVQSDSIVSSDFWASLQPAHEDGNCVQLQDVGGLFKLSMQECEDSKSFLCEFND